MTTDHASVLVVEDDPEVAAAHAARLRPAYSVETVGTGRAALSALDPTVDVVLLDRGLPDLSGDEVLRRISAGEADPMVCMVTGTEPDGEALGLPFDAYLVKPVAGDDLRGTVERLLCRAEVTARQRELFAIAEKLALLESTPASDDRERARLRAEFEALRARLDEDVAALPADDRVALFGD